MHLEKRPWKGWDVLACIPSLLALTGMLLACAPAGTSSNRTATPENAAATRAAPGPSALPSVAPTRAATAAPTMPAAASPTLAGRSPAATPNGAWKGYKNPRFGLCLQYPAAWFGPEVNEYQTGLELEVGTSRVYPSGTPLEQRTQPNPDAYFITFRYVQRPPQFTPDQFKADQPWLQEYLDRLTWKDGEIRSTLRSQVTRTRSVKIGELAGAEFIVTLPDTAGTEIVYLREVFVTTPQFDTIRVMGQAENVAGAKPDWKSAYRRVDEMYLETFRRFVSSVSFCGS